MVDFLECALSVAMTTTNPTWLWIETPTFSWSFHINNAIDCRNHMFVVWLCALLSLNRVTGLGGSFNTFIHGKVYGEVNIYRTSDSNSSFCFFFLHFIVFFFLPQYFSFTSYYEVHIICYTYFDICCLYLLNLVLKCFWSVFARKRKREKMRHSKALKSLCFFFVWLKYLISVTMNECHSVMQEHTNIKQLFFALCICLPYCNWFSECAHLNIQM